MSRTDVDPTDVNPTDHPDTRRRTVRAPRRRTRLAAITVVLAAALTGCGDDDASSSPGGADAAPGSASADVGADGNGGQEAGGEDTGDGAEPGQADPPAPTGEARATIEMRGEVHHLALDHDVVQMGQVRCDIDPEAQDASVGGMVSAEGLELHMLPAVGYWAAVVIEPDGGSWRAGAADPHPDTDYTIEVTEGRLVIDGTWGAGDGSDRLEEIRVELICPPTEEGTNG